MPIAPGPSRGNGARREMGNEYCYSAHLAEQGQLLLSTAFSIMFLQEADITLTPNATGATRQSCRKTNAFNRLRHAIYELQTPMIPALFKSRLRSGNLEVENVCSIDNQRSPKYRTEREKQICLPVEQTTSLLWLLSNETGVNNETMFTES